MEKLINGYKYNEYKKYIANDMKKKYDLSEDAKRFIQYNYDYLIELYGTITPTNEEYEKIYIDEMKIGYKEYLKEEIILKIKEIFKDTNLNFKIDELNKLKDIITYTEKGYNLSNIEIIKIILYSKNETYRDILLNYLSNTNLNKELIIELIRPISNILIKDLLEDEGSNYLIPYYNKCFNYLENEDIEGNKDETENYYEQTRSNYKITCNTFYIKEMEHFFQNVLIKYLDKLDDENLHIIYNIKKYSLDTCPEATGYTWVKDVYGEVGYDVLDDGENRECACCSYHREYRRQLVGTKKINTINMNCKDVLDNKKNITLVLDMFINNNINYKKLFYSNANEYLIDLLKCKDNIVNKTLIKK
jgi:hypothetical protein